MLQHVTSFPWRYLKIFPLGMSQHFIYDPNMGMGCHGMSPIVTACYGIRCDKGGVTNSKSRVFRVVFRVSKLEKSSFSSRVTSRVYSKSRVFRVGFRVWVLKTRTWLETRLFSSSIVWLITQFFFLVMTQNEYKCTMWTVNLRYL